MPDGNIQELAWQPLWNQIKTTFSSSGPAGLQFRMAPTSDFTGVPWRTSAGSTAFTATYPFDRANGWVSITRVTPSSNIAMGSGLGSSIAAP